MLPMRFQPGNNLALKVPAHLFDETVAFYAEILNLEPWPEADVTPSFRFGGHRLWIDRVPALSQPELWLEVFAEDATAAAEYLEAKGVRRVDEVESLAEGFRGFWVVAPGGMVHLICEPH